MHCRHWTRLAAVRLEQHALSVEDECVDVLPCLAVVPFMHSLRKLEISFSITADAAVLHTLGSMTQLTALHMQLASGPHDLTPLARLTQLRELEMRAYADTIGGWLPTSLQYLTLGPNQAGDNGDSWAPALAACSQLRSLTLQGLNPWWEDAANNQLDLAHATQLTRLDGYVMGNMLALTGLPPSLRELMLTVGGPPEQRESSLDEPGCYLPNGPSTLMGCVDLEALQVECRGGVLPPLPKLRKACVGIADLNGDGDVAGIVASALCSLPATLTSLKVVPFECSIAPMEHLTHCVNLQELCLNADNTCSIALDCQHLQHLTALTKLVLIDAPLCTRRAPHFTILHEEQLHLPQLEQFHVPEQLVEFKRRLQECVGDSQCVAPSP